MRIVIVLLSQATAFSGRVVMTMSNDTLNTHYRYDIRKLRLVTRFPWGNFHCSDAAAKRLVRLLDLGLLYFSIEGAIIYYWAKSGPARSGYWVMAYHCGGWIRTPQLGPVKSTIGKGPQDKVVSS